MLSGNLVVVRFFPSLFMRRSDKVLLHRRDEIFLDKKGADFRRPSRSVTGKCRRESIDGGIEGDCRFSWQVSIVFWSQM